MLAVWGVGHSAECKFFHYLVPLCFEIGYLADNTIVQTPVGMTSADLLMDPNTFPNPKVFDPERWLVENPDYAKNMSFFAPFHRDHRNCLGLK